MCVERAADRSRPGEVLRKVRFCDVAKNQLADFLGAGAVASRAVNQRQGKRTTSSLRLFLTTFASCSEPGRTPQ